MDAVIAVGEIGHGFVLFVDDADAGLVGADCDCFDVGGGFAPGAELGVEEFGGFDCGLGVEFGWKEDQSVGLLSKRKGREGGVEYQGRRL